MCSLFLKMRTLETLFNNLLLEVFDCTYTDVLRDATDMVRIPISQIMIYLVDTFSQMTPEKLRAHKKELEGYVYNPNLPIDVFFNKLDFFADLTNYSKKPLSDSNKVDIAHITLNRCG